MAGFSVWSMIIVTVAFHATHAEEPQCSKYDFLEKLLDKVIRMEINFETMHKELLSSLNTIRAEMKSTKDNVEKSLAIAAEERAKIKGEQSALENNLIAGCEEKTKALDETLSQQQSTINRMSEDFRKLENEPIKNIDTKVSFKAKLSRTTTVSSGQTVVFLKTELNLGNHYDVQTGKFTVPVTGTYLLTVQICPRNGNAVVVNVATNEKILNRARVGDKVYYMCYSLTDIFNLQQGMKVWITLSKSQTSTVYLEQDTGYYDNIFSGVLL